MIVIVYGKGIIVTISDQKFYYDSFFYEKKLFDTTL